MGGDVSTWYTESAIVNLCKIKKRVELNCFYLSA